MFARLLALKVDGEFILLQMDKSFFDSVVREFEK